MSDERKKLTLTASGMKHLQALRGNPRRSQGATIQMAVLNRVANFGNGRISERNLISDIPEFVSISRQGSKNIVKRMKQRGWLREITV